VEAERAPGGFVEIDRTPRDTSRRLGDVGVDWDYKDLGFVDVCFEFGLVVTGCEMLPTCLGQKK
jgi:hypothetical protein